MICLEEIAAENGGATAMVFTLLWRCTIGTIEKDALLELNGFTENN
jgi:hypothetical protein